MAPNTVAADGIAMMAAAEPETVAVFEFQFAKGAPTPPTDEDKVYSVDLRGDTDESFDRGIRYLVKNQFLQR